MPVTVDQVKDRVAAALKLSAGAAGLEPWWDTVCSDALASALADVRGALIGRGFSQTQLDAWGSFDAVVSDQAVFWAATNAGGLEAFDDKFIKMMDRREWLKTGAVTDASGNLAGSAAVGHGSLRRKAAAVPVFPGDTFVDEEGRFKRW